MHPPDMKQMPNTSSHGEYRDTENNKADDKEPEKTVSNESDGTAAPKNDKNYT